MAGTPLRTKNRCGWIAVEFSGDGAQGQKQQYDEVGDNQTLGNGIKFMRTAQ
jgi:hypothetical protein